MPSVDIVFISSWSSLEEDTSLAGGARECGTHYYSAKRRVFLVGSKLAIVFAIVSQLSYHSAQ